MINKLTKSITTFLLLLSSLPVFAGLTAVGPINPRNGFPLWYEDSNGLRIELGLDPALNLFDPPIPGNAFSERIGFGAEGFYWLAESMMNIPPSKKLPSGGKAFLRLALEYAFFNEEPAPGDQMVFMRLRLRIDAPVDGTYKIIHPYGVEIIKNVKAGTKSINKTIDFGAEAPGDFGAALSGPIGPFLTAANPASPTGFVGDPLAQQTVTGSPSGTNFFRIEGPKGTNLDGKGNNFVQTDLFSLSGKIFSFSPNPEAINTLSAVTGDNEGEIKLSWLSVGNDGPIGDIIGGKYRISYSTDPAHNFNVNDFNIELTTSTSPAQPQSYTLTGLSSGSTYYIRVWTGDAEGNFSAVSNPASAMAQVAITEVDIVAPGAIGNLQAVTGHKEGQVILTWTSPGDDGQLNDLIGGKFRIKYTADPNHVFIPTDFTVELPANTSPGALVTHTLAGLTPGATYYFKVWSIDNMDNTSQESNLASAMSQIHIGLAAVGPTNPRNGFPLWYEDFNGLRIELGLDPALNLFDPPIPGNAFSEQIGFGGEGFYWIAESAMGVPPSADLPLGGNAFLRLALEYAFANEDPAPGDQMVFTRVRLRIDTPVAGTYKIIHPYGVEVFENVPAGDRAINSTVDVGFLPLAFDQALNGLIGPSFLTVLTPPAPAGFVGGGVLSQHTVTGSPLGTNFFRIEGPEGANMDGVGNNFVETNLFMLAGKIFTSSSNPAVINDLKAETGQNEGEIKLSWLSVGNDGPIGDIIGGKYRISYSTDPAHNFNVNDFNVELTTSTSPAQPQSYTLTGLTGGSTYDIRVWTGDAEGNFSAVSNPASVMAQVDVAAPSAITDLVAVTGQNEGEMKLNWTAPGDDGLLGNITGGKVRIKYTTDPLFNFDVNDFSLEISTDTTTGQAQSYLIIGLTGGTTYYVRAWSGDERGNFSQVSNAASAVSQGAVVVSTPPAGVDAVAPSAVSDLVMSAGQNEGELKLNWSAPGDDGLAGDITGGKVRIMYTTDPAFGSNISVEISTDTIPGQIQSYLITGLTGGTTYYVRLWTADEQGNFSGVSNTVGAMSQADVAPPAAVTNLLARAGLNKGEVILTWTSPGDDGALHALIGGRFRIKYSTNTNNVFSPDDFSLELPANTLPAQNITHTVTGLTTGATYYFKVWTLDDLGNISEGSNPASAIPQGNVGLSAVGPVNPNNGLPLWYEDSNGLRLELGLDPQLNIFDPPIPGNAFSQQIGFGTEGFYFLAEAMMDTTAGSAFYEAALEYAFANEAPADGDQMVFARLRFRIDTPVPGTYKVIHPYGVEVFENVPAGDRAINKTIDVGTSLLNFAEALNCRVGPFLVAVNPPAPNGFIGSPLIDQTATGSPFGTNFVRIEGPEGADLDGQGNNFIQTELFNISGKIQIPGDISSSLGALGATPSSDLGSLVVFPNPYKPNSGLGHDKVVFSGLTASAKIKVFSLSGIKVREIDKNDSLGAFTWDARNEEGEQLASGLYLYIVTGENGQEKKGKIAIIK